MVNHLGRLPCWAVCIAVALAWLPRPSQAQEVHPIVALAKKMAQPIDYPGIPNGVALRDALGLLTKQSGVRIDVNYRAFERAGGAAAVLLPGGLDPFLIAAQDRGALPGGKGGQGDIGPAGLKPGAGDKAPPAGGGVQPGPRDNDDQVLESPVGAVPKMKGVRLETVLKRILARAQTPAGPVDYVLRREGIEITTARAKIAEFYRSANHPPAGNDPLEEGPDADQFRLLPLVQVQFTRTLLDDALHTLANATDQSIVLDPRANEEPKPVTATLLNVPLDTAVELLANMAGLKVVTRDRVLFVTTKKNADAMEQELRDRTPLPPAPVNPGIGTAPGGGPSPGIGPFPGSGPGGPIVPGGGGTPLGHGGVGPPPGPQPPAGVSAELADLQAELAAAREELARLRKKLGGTK